jgi:flagellar L-ring protein precursor FlgH
MNADLRRASRVILTTAVLAALPAGVSAQAQSGKNYEEIYEKYLAAARTAPVSNRVWMAELMGDRRAGYINDLVTIRVEENVTATGSADSTVNKKGDANVSMPEPISKGLEKFLPTNSETKFKGSGSTSRQTTLSANMTARVVEVLPNGDLVVEGVREIDVNGDRQLVVLTGVVRVLDILPGNIVTSARIGQLRIRSLSQGLIKDSLTPGWLIRALNKVF